MAETAATLWTRILGIVAGSLASFAVAAIALIVVPALDAQREHSAAIHALQVELASIHADRESDIETVKYWRRQIEAATEGLARLRNDASARRDPFTGSDGDALEKRIDSLERWVAAVAAMKDRLDRVEREVDEQRAYLRRVFPHRDQ